MNYTDAAKMLKDLLNDVNADEAVAEGALEEIGAVHTEALLASLAAYKQACGKLGDQPACAQELEIKTMSGAALQPMPEQSAEITLDFPLTAEQFATMQEGKPPEDYFHRWFLVSDGMHIRYYRDATGYCFFDGEIEQTDDGYKVGKVIVNQEPLQYSEENLKVCAAQMKILIANNLGLDDEPYWDEMDRVVD